MKGVTSDEMLRRVAGKRGTGDLRMGLPINTLWGKGTPGTEAS